MLPAIIFWEVDAQADFMLPEGGLYVPHAEKIIPNIQRLVDEVRDGRVFLVSSGDAHSPDDPEFQLFPRHCVKGSSGARVIPEGLAARVLTIPNQASFLLPANIFDYQQILLEKQTLDVFNNPQAGELVELIHHRFGPGVEYFVFGVVTEYCVRCAAQGLLDRGCRVAIVEDAIETLQAEQGRSTIGELQRLGARLITTDQAIELAEARSAHRVP
jgi:nicotinamidase/pyrazinamidase